MPQLPGLPALGERMAWGPDRESPPIGAFAGIRRGDRPVPSGRDAAAEEDLRLDELPVPHGDHLYVAVSLAGLQLVLVENEDVVARDRYEVKDLLRGQALGGGEAAVKERRLVDVVVLRTREGEVLSDQSVRGVPVLGDLG